MSNDLDKIITKVFLTVTINWNNISLDNDTMNVLNMETNSLCKHFKEQNPTLTDIFIQSYVLTMYMIMIIFLSRPIQEVFNDFNLMNYLSIQTGNNELISNNSIESNNINSESQENAQNIMDTID